MMTLTACLAAIKQSTPHMHGSPKIGSSASPIAVKVYRFRPWKTSIQTILWPAQQVITAQHHPLIYSQEHKSCCMIGTICWNPICLGLCLNPRQSSGLLEWQCSWICRVHAWYKARSSANHLLDALSRISMQITTPIITERCYVT